MTNLSTENGAFLEKVIASVAINFFFYHFKGMLLSSYGHGTHDTGLATNSKLQNIIWHKTRNYFDTNRLALWKQPLFVYLRTRLLIKESHEFIF